MALWVNSLFWWSTSGFIFHKNQRNTLLNTFIWHLRSIKSYLGHKNEIVWTGNNHLCFPTEVFSFKDITIAFYCFWSKHPKYIGWLFSPHLIRQLSPNAIPLIRPDFRCTEIVKFYLFKPFKRDIPSCKATFPLEEGRDCHGLDRMVIGFSAISDCGRSVVFSRYSGFLY